MNAAAVPMVVGGDAGPSWFSRRSRRLTRSRAPKRTDFDLLILGPHALEIAAALGEGYQGRLAVVDDPLTRSRRRGPIARRKALMCARLLAIARADMRDLDRGDVAPDDSHLFARIRAAAATEDAPTILGRLEEHGVRCFRGVAHVTEPYHALVDLRQLSARALVVATESRMPERGFSGSDLCDDEETVWSWSSLPARVVVVGSGPGLCEHAQCLARLGCIVTLVTSDPTPLPDLDGEAATTVIGRLRADGVDLRLGTDCNKVERHGAELRVTVTASGNSKTVVAERVLYIVPRLPHLSGCGFDRPPVRYLDSPSATFDGFHRTDIAGLFVCGPVVGPRCHAHPANRQHWHVAFDGFLRGQIGSPRLFPRAVMTDPEVASLPLGGDSARDHRGDSRTSRYRCGRSGRGQTSRLIVASDGSKPQHITLIGWDASERLTDLVHRPGLTDDMITALAGSDQAIAESPVTSPALELLPIVLVERSPEFGRVGDRPRPRPRLILIAAMLAIVCAIIACLSAR